MLNFTIYNDTASRHRDVMTRYGVWLRALLLTVLLTVSASLSAQTASQALESFVESSAINTDHTAVMMVDLADGTIMAEHNADRALIPASIMKCVTVAGLMSKHDLDWRYATEVLRTGQIRNCVLDGNIIVRGSGDPSLNSKYIENNPDITAEIAAALAEAGIKTIRGRVIIDEDIYEGPVTPPSWASGDLSQSYGTGQHGLNFADNASGSRAVSQPATVFMSALRKALADAGISLQNESVANGKETLLMTHLSAPLDEIMRSCMMRSDNQYAEAMLRQIAIVHGDKGSTAKGARRNMELWRNRRLNMDNVTIVDGSGLSRSNRVTARFMSEVLRYMSDDPWYASFFPLAGEEGTLRKFMAGTPLQGYVALKTGSMNGIQCYAGYKLDDDYVPTHIIVIIMNEMANRNAARQAVSDLLIKTFCTLPQ